MRSTRFSIRQKKRRRLSKKVRDVFSPLPSSLSSSFDVLVDKCITSRASCSAHYAPYLLIKHRPQINASGGSKIIIDAALKQENNLRPSFDDCEKRKSGTTW